MKVSAEGEQFLMAEFSRGSGWSSSAWNREWEPSTHGESGLGRGRSASEYKITTPMLEKRTEARAIANSPEATAVDQVSRVTVT